MRKEIKRILTFVILFIMAICIVFMCACTNDDDLKLYIDSNGMLVYEHGGEKEILGKVTGEDGTNLTIDDVYYRYISETGDYSLSMTDFIIKYISFELVPDCSNSINSCLRSAVKVFSEFDMPFTSNMGPFWRPSDVTVEYVELIEGSGIIYDVTTDDDYIYFVTNYHVVAESDRKGNTVISDRIHLYLYGSESEPECIKDSYGYPSEYEYDSYAIPCEYVGGSIKSDIAVIKALKEDVYEINSGVVAVSFAEPDIYGNVCIVGESCFTIGNSEGMGLSVTQGIVSKDSEDISLTICNQTNTYRSMRIDSAVYSGNSGGGLFNKNGELIGIVNAGYASDESINYAIPLSLVKSTADNILYYAMEGDTGKCAYTLNKTMTIEARNTRYIYDETTSTGHVADDTIVVNVIEDSFQDLLGLTSGDIITKVTINSIEFNITRMYQLSEMGLFVRPGDKIKYTYIRGDGEEETTEVYTLQNSDFSQRD